MTKLKLLSAGLIAAAMIANARHGAANITLTKRHVAEEANANAFFPSSGFTDGRGCIPAPRVGAFATAPVTGDNVPCRTLSSHHRSTASDGLASGTLDQIDRLLRCCKVERVGLEGTFQSNSLYVS